jgi:hypothetical protein
MFVIETTSAFVMTLCVHHLHMSLQTQIKHLELNHGNERFLLCLLPKETEPLICMTLIIVLVTTYTLKACAQYSCRNGVDTNTKHLNFVVS